MILLIMVFGASVLPRQMQEAVSHFHKRILRITASDVKLYFT